MQVNGRTGRVPSRRRFLTWRRRRYRHISSLGCGAHRAQAIRGQHLRPRQARVAQERRIRPPGAGPPAPVRRPGLVTERRHQRLRLPDRARGWRACRRSRCGGALNHLGFRRVGPASRQPCPGALLRRCNVLRNHVRGQSITLSRRLGAPAPGRQVEPHMRENVVLRNAQAPRERLAERQHRLAVAGPSRRLPLRQGLGVPSRRPRCLSRLVIRTRGGRARQNCREAQGNSQCRIAIHALNTLLEITRTGTNPIRTSMLRSFISLAWQTRRI